MNSRPAKFILKVRRKDSNKDPPNTLYQIACSIQRDVQKYAPEVTFFANPEFSSFKRVLDGEIKRLQEQGLGTNIKRAELISQNKEKIMWEKGILGKSFPQALLDTMVYMCGVFFALRSSQEHW